MLRVTRSFVGRSLVVGHGQSLRAVMHGVGFRLLPGSCVNFESFSASCILFMVIVRRPSSEQTKHE